MITFSQTAKLLEVVQKPYKVNGNEGISYKLRLLVGDDIYQLNSSLEETEYYKGQVGKIGTAEFKVVSRKEDVTLKLVMFTEKK